MRTAEYKEGFYTIYTHKKVNSCEQKGETGLKKFEESSNNSRKKTEKNYLFWSKNQDNIFLHTDRFLLNYNLIFVKSSGL